MRAYSEYFATSLPGAPFSNGTAWEIFQWNECLGRGRPQQHCINDANDDCPLIALSLAARTPAEFTLHRDGHYRCTVKATPADARRARIAAEKAALEADHYPMFSEEEPL